MKKISKAPIPGWLLAMGALLAFASPAASQDDEAEGGEPEAAVERGLYLQVGGGSTRSLDQDADFRTALGSLSGDVDFKAGFMGGGAIGFRINRLRFEIASQFRRQEVASITFQSVVGQTGGDLDVTTGLANVLYDFEFGWPVDPYIGAGIGVARLDMDAEVRPQIFVFDDVVNEIAWNAMAGVSLSVAPGAELFLGYRRLQLFDEASIDASFPGVVSGDLEMDFSTNEFEMGIRYTF